MQEDMRAFVRPGAYELALSMFTSFGYFDDKDEDRTVLRNIYASLRPGGALAMDVAGKELVAAAFESTRSRKHADGSVVIDTREVLDDWTRIRMEWTIIRGMTTSVSTPSTTQYTPARN